MKPGTKLGPYEVVAPLGAGGMGEVFRARDTKLGRDVAIKVLPAALAQDIERVARFRREAQILATLNHPNIAAIYGIVEGNPADAGSHTNREHGSSDPPLSALVMELVEGEDLAQRIARGPIPLEDALPLARQIADALETAHDQGIIHRDLKPANVKVRADGTVKVLDFGLAKAMDPASGSGLQAPDAMLSPTLTARATQPGMILGTAAYMAPEQAKGKATDRRADIWAFGAVIFEMLTGRRAFAGDDVSEVLASVLRQDVDWSALPANTPPSVRRLLRRCLERDPRRRLHHLADGRLDLDDAEAPSNTPVSEVRAGRRVRSALGIAAAIALGLAAGALAVWMVRAAPAPPPVVRVAITLPVTDELVQQASGLAVTPDGTQVVFRLARAGRRGLFVRSLGELEPRFIPGTEEGTAPFLSPDGRWIAFFRLALNSADVGGLKRIRIDGGTPTQVAPIAGVTGLGWTGHWCEDGQILFSGASPVIQRVPSTGGPATAITVLDEKRGEQSHVQPHMLPGGSALLYVATLSGGRQDIVAASIDGTRTKVLVEGATAPRYLSTGHLLFVRDTTLFAASFDPARLELVGEPVPVIQRLKVMVYASYRHPQFDVSPRGALAYLTEDDADRDAHVVFVDREGKARLAFDEVGAFLVPRLSPDGHRLAYASIDLRSGQRDVWVRDLDRGTRTRLTFGQGLSTDPVWSPDGRSITFTSSRDGSVLHMFSVPADGGQDPVRLTREDNSTAANRFIFPRFWLPDGAGLVFQRVTDSPDIGIWRKASASEEMLIASRFGDLEPSLSPDGRFIAWVSDESGRREVYMRLLSDASRRLQVSTDGGDEPVWSPRGGELFYRRGPKMIAVPVSTAGEGRAGASSVLFEGRYEIDPFNNDSTNYDVTKDGQHFVMIRRLVDADRSRQQLNVVLHWFEELQAKVPTR